MLKRDFAVVKHCAPYTLLASVIALLATAILAVMYLVLILFSVVIHANINYLLDVNWSVCFNSLMKSWGVLTVFYFLKYMNDEWPQIKRTYRNEL